MAIKVNGTSVISDSRVLENVTGLKTVGSTSLLGSGDIAVGSSTTYGAVGTYVGAHRVTATNVSYNGGDTVSGSDLKTVTSGNTRFAFSGQEPSSELGSSGLSGTWRQMSTTIRLDYVGGLSGLFVRIS